MFPQTLVSQTGHIRHYPKNTSSSDNPVHNQAFGNPLRPTTMYGFQEVLPGDLLWGSPLTGERKLIVCRLQLTVEAFVFMKQLCLQHCCLVCFFNILTVIIFFLVLSWAAGFLWAAGPFTWNDKAAFRSGFSHAADFIYLIYSITLLLPYTVSWASPQHFNNW